MESEIVRTIRNALAGIRNESDPRTMPSVFYTSSEFLALEQSALFEREWVCLGHTGEIPNPGDYYTTDMADEPLLVLRDHAGKILVLSNVCRHRGKIIAEGAGNSRRFICSYHAWSYGHDGQLINAPHMNDVPGFDKAACRLPRFRHEIWNGFIYVNLSGNAAPLGPRLSDLEAIIGNYALGERNLVHTEEDRWRTNWKCLAENFMEGYHLTPTHARTLHPITPTSLCRKMPAGDGFTGYWSGYNPSYPDRKPFPEKLTETERRQSPMFWVAPNHVVGLATNNCVYMCLRPRGVDQVAIRWGVLSTAQAQDKAASDYVELCHAFNAEDKVKLESLQVGLKSRHLQRGFLAPADFEGTIWDMYQYFARRLGSDVPMSHE